MLKSRMRRGRARIRLTEDALWSRDDLTPSLGCAACPARQPCGGLRTHAAFFDCDDRCCRSPSTCVRVCRRKPYEFVHRVREINGFDLGNALPAPVLACSSLPGVAHMMFHGGGRSEFQTSGCIALPLHALIERSSGACRFQGADDLRQRFRLGREVQIIVSGTDQDGPLERWWSFGEEVRLKTLRQLANFELALSTTPNFSMFVDGPRWDDLHAMKRIAIMHSEFQRAGMVTALHVNCRTSADAARWTKYIEARPEITHLAYEFATGPGRAQRRALHAAWLSGMAEQVSRPLTLVVRGGKEVWSLLAYSFAKLIVIDTTSFMKTMHRQRAESSGSGLTWLPFPTLHGAPLDELWDHNTSLERAYVERIVGPGTPLQLDQHRAA